VRFGFLINEVLTGFRRNVTMTIAMILTTAISIGLFGGGLLVVRLADQSRDIYLDRVESQVFLTNDVSANDPTCDGDACKALRAKIEGRDDVKSVRFLNRDDAYDDAINKKRSRRRSSSSSRTRSSTRILTRRWSASPAYSTC
jgi:cell division transport system permease protein